MEREGLRTGHLVALAGAAVVLASLWLPWFELRLGQVERDQVSQGAGQLGAPFAALAQGLLEQIDGLRIDAWSAFGGEDVALAGGAGVVGLVLLAVAGAAGPGVRVDASAAARLAALVGIGLGAVVALRLLSRPAPPEILALGLGGWVALAGCGLMGLGGLLAVRISARSPGANPNVLLGDVPATPVVVAPAAATSVAPPPRA